MKHVKLAFLASLVALFSFFVVGCDDDDSPTTSGESTAALTCSIDLSEAFANDFNITKVIFIVENESVSDSLELTISGTTASGTISKLKPGSYEVTILAYVGTELVATATGTGEATTDQTVTVTVTITYVKGNLDIEITFPTTVDELKMVVFSDPHFYDATLGTEGSDFEEYLASDRKLIVESEPILREVVDAIKASDVDIVLVPGDLTKDGEMQCHSKFASYMAELEADGKRVYVIPGNHDINNEYGAKGYTSSGSYSVPTITASNFTTIYYDYGYSEAIARDENSLSYIAELSDDVWLLGIDACRYSESAADNNVTGGKISDATMEWIKAELHEAKEQGKTVLGMMHHGILEHYTGQTDLFSEYVVEDWQTVYKTFADSGLKVVFTGHFHSNDIVKGTGSSSDAFVFDIETGSTVTYPCPYRMVTLSSNALLQIETRHVTDPDVNYSGVSFVDSAKTYLSEGLYTLALGMLVQNFGLTADAAQTPATLLAEAFMAHYAGDEDISNMSATNYYILENVLRPSTDATTQVLVSVLDALWTDNAPLDNNITINLNTGAVVE
ncbi:metallophosphoesterase [Chloroherpeton thalassium ATCC 35110]|uniref:Metallophosphoesterase n=1 Tax=Chloroherpeton thalassium (strain ATCC 35110 / GB-78) TaxID=517418 RepID=B3QSK0_CHLT3|nr:metallophosphoesterase [Chloroherpeton thalassium]ACF14047.1 metallophosphoesterase [Chloroherpeton thalassium ATCC 35110]